MARSEGKHYRFRTIEFWAEDGLVRVLDTRRAQASSAHVDEFISSIQPGEFIVRCIAARSQAQDKYPHEAAEARRLLTEGVECAKLAKSQGNPCDADVQEHVARHNRKSSIIVPGLNDGPLGGRQRIIDPTKYKFQAKSPVATLLHGAEVVPDFELPLSKSVTLERARQLVAARRARA
jgi:hypothetical protein